MLLNFFNASYFLELTFNDSNLIRLFECLIFNIYGNELDINATFISRLFQTLDIPIVFSIQLLVRFLEQCL